MWLVVLIAAGIIAGSILAVGRGGGLTAAEWDTQERAEREEAALEAALRRELRMIAGFIVLVGLAIVAAVVVMGGR
jgi:hypothetical protein